MSDVAVVSRQQSPAKVFAPRPPRAEDGVDPQDVGRLRAWLRLQPHLPHDIPDYMLTLFLHSQNQSLELAKMILDRSYSIRTAAPELFSNRDPFSAEIQDALDVVWFGMLPTPTPKGYHACVVGFRNPDPSKFMFVEALKAGLMVLELVQIWHGPVPGYLLIMDMNGTTMAHVTRVNFASMKRALDFQQEGLPVRLKGVHVINAIPLVHHILAIMRPCVKPEARELINVHTEGQVTKFYESVPQKLMPREYGGEAPSIEVLHGLVRRDLEQRAVWFREEERLRVLECRRPAQSQPYLYSEAFGCNGSFKKLAID